MMAFRPGSYIDCDDPRDVRLIAMPPELDVLDVLRAANGVISEEEFDAMVLTRYVMR